ncbi:hypothetical protein [Shinella zoogloeoides]|uniref:hypothetical protein n=1 Tax=Shinella zoogloeoides TaxID=352475 RepID=UPI0027400BBD|nr:hypothetical protein [Shinella zoogloeoides]WLR90990.1 hypothetical protein Q9316_00140 [Shinella zoogloeoides]
MRRNKPKRTDKQRQIMHLVLEAADNGTFYTMTELHQALPYTCAYGSLRTSIKFLVARGIVTKERAGLSKIIRPTPSAYDWFRTGGRI